MGVSKLIYKNETLVDLTNTTVATDNLHTSQRAHGADGNLVTGAAASSFPVEDSIVDGSIVGVYENNNVTTNIYFRRLPQLTKVSVPNATSLASYAFQGDTSLTEVKLSDSITSIPTYCFQGCTNLTEVDNIIKNATVISGYAFNNCSSLRNIHGPKVTNVVQNALTGTAIESITNDNFPLVTGQILFGKGMTSLKYTRFVSSQMQLSSGSGAFQNCTNLEKAEFPNAIGSTGNFAFGGCTKLTLVDMGLVGFSNNNAFTEDHALVKLILRRATVTPLNALTQLTNTPFRGYNNLVGTAYVPQALIEDYKIATNWSTIYEAGTCVFEPIEGSEHEFCCTDGTPINPATSFEWTPSDGSLEDLGWTRNITGTASINYTNDGVVLTSAGGNNYCYLQYQNVTKGAIEVVMSFNNSVSGTQNNRISLSNGTNGIQIYCNGNKWRLMNNGGTPGSGEIIADAVANTDYTIHLELNNSVGLVKINGEVVASGVDASTISYCARSAIWSQNQGNYSGTFKSIKFYTFE